MGLAATGGVGDVTLVTEQNVPLTGLQGQGFVGTPQLFKVVVLMLLYQDYQLQRQ